MSAIAIEVLTTCPDEGHVHATSSLQARSGGTVPVLSAQLMRYWRDELVRPLGIRRRTLEAALAGGDSGGVHATTLLPFALGDTDEDIVFRATLAFLQASRAPGSQQPAAAAMAAGWIRHRLALNRAAVFAALLSTGDARVLDLLLPLRQTLDSDEIERVRRRQADGLPASARAFLREWLELLSGA